MRVVAEFELCILVAAKSRSPVGAEQSAFTLATACVIRQRDPGVTLIDDHRFVAAAQEGDPREMATFGTVRPGEGGESAFMEDGISVGSKKGAPGAPTLVVITQRSACIAITGKNRLTRGPEKGLPGWPAMHVIIRHHPREAPFVEDRLILAIQKAERDVVTVAIVAQPDLREALLMKYRLAVLVQQRDLARPPVFVAANGDDGKPFAIGNERPVAGVGGAPDESEIAVIGKGRSVDSALLIEGLALAVQLPIGLDQTVLCVSVAPTVAPAGIGERLLQPVLVTKFDRESVGIVADGMAHDAVAIGGKLQERGMVRVSDGSRNGDRDQRFLPRPGFQIVGPALDVDATQVLAIDMGAQKMIRGIEEFDAQRASRRAIRHLPSGHPFAIADERTAGLDEPQLHDLAGL